jgi:hypothetical protein
MPEKPRRGGKHHAAAPPTPRRWGIFRPLYAGSVTGLVEADAEDEGREDVGLGFRPPIAPTLSRRRAATLLREDGAVCSSLLAEPVRTVVVGGPVAHDPGRYQLTMCDPAPPARSSLPPSRSPPARSPSAPSRRQAVAGPRLRQPGMANRRTIKKWLDTLSLVGERPRRRTPPSPADARTPGWAPTAT